MKMFMYYHVDRGLRLKEGDIIKPEPYNSPGVLSAIFPFADESFIRHLRGLCKNGLSLHGAHYLVHAAHDDVSARDMLIELQFEYVRNVYHKELPSRLQGMFAFNSLDAAMDFLGLNNRRGKIFEVDTAGRHFVADMNWLTLGADIDAEAQKRKAVGYWDGNPASDESGYVPKWECLIDLPVCWSVFC